MNKTAFTSELEAMNESLIKSYLMACQYMNREDKQRKAKLN